MGKHYADLAKKPFFAGLVKYMASGPVVAMVWEGLNAVKTGRVMLGETNPADSKPSTRLLSGSSPRSWWPGNQHRRIGSTNRFWSSNLLRGQHIYASFYKIVLEFYLQWLNCPGLKSYLVNLVQFL